MEIVTSGDIRNKGTQWLLSLKEFIVYSKDIRKDHRVCIILREMAQSEMYNRELTDLDPETLILSNYVSVYKKKKRRNKASWSKLIDWVRWCNKNLK